MDTDELFRRDCLEILSERMNSGSLSKRDFLKLSGIFGVTAGALASGVGAAAAAEPITIANYGGDAIKVYAEALTQPFTASSGIPVNIDGSGPLIGRLRKMVEDRQVSWDVADGADYYSPKLGKDFLEPIDYSIVDKSKYFEWNALPYAAGSYTYSNVLAYDSSKFPEPPKSWADFFDLKKFPGKRLLYKWFDNQPEIFMLAAGRDPKNLYPIDMDLVAKMVKSLGDNLVLWDSGGVSQQLFLDGEVAMGNIWNTRARTLERDTKGRVKWTWNQQIVTAATWVIPKGTKQVKAAQQFIASTTDPVRQIKMLDAMGNGPANPAAIGLLNAEQKHVNPTSNMETAIVHDVDWYAKNKDDALYKWLDAVG